MNRLVALGLLALGGCLGAPGSNRSGLELEDPGGDGEVGQECADPLSQGYWKNHHEAWPNEAIVLGNVEYSHAALGSILHTPVRGNGLVSLAHQLVAAKLNVANGAPDAAADAIAEADAMIGDLVAPPIGDGSLRTADTSPLVEALDDYNNGRLDGLCDDPGLEVWGHPVTRGSFRRF